MYIHIKIYLPFSGYYLDSTVLCLEDEAVVIRYSDIHFYLVDSNLAWVSSGERSLPCHTFIQAFFDYLAGLKKNQKKKLKTSFEISCCSNDNILKLPYVICVKIS